LVNSNQLNANFILFSNYYQTVGYYYVWQYLLNILHQYAKQRTFGNYFGSYQISFSMQLSAHRRAMN